MYGAVRWKMSPPAVPEIGAWTKCHEYISRNIELHHLPYHLDRSRRNTNPPEGWQEDLSMPISGSMISSDLRLESQP